MYHCNNCGEQVDDGASFCPNCGDTITATPGSQSRESSPPNRQDERQPPQEQTHQQGGQHAPDAQPPRSQPQGRQPAQQQPPHEVIGQGGDDGIDRRTLLIGGGAAAVALAGGGWYFFIRETYPDSPIGVVKLEWEAWAEGDVETYDEIFHSESPERDEDRWTAMMTGEEELGPEEGVEWNIEQRNLDEKMAGEATVQEVYTWYNPDPEGMDEATYGRLTDNVELRTEGGDWKMWRRNNTDWQELEGSPDSA